MTSNANTNSSFRNRLLALLDKHVVIPRVEKIFLAKSGRENLGRGEEHRDNLTDDDFIRLQTRTSFAYLD